MKPATPPSLMPALLTLGLCANTTWAQQGPHYAPATPPPAPLTAPLRVEPLVLDESELEAAIRAAQPDAGDQVQWAIAPAPGASPVPPPAPVSDLAPAGPDVAPADPAPAPPPDPVSMPEPAPASSSASSVPHFSGGVGYDERARMEAVKAQFNLRLLFAVAGEGSYLSGVRVTIKDAHGATQLDTIANGPWFYAQLPPGFHVLTLDNQGQIQQRKVTVPAQGAVVENFYWQGRATSAPEEKTNGWAVRPAPVKPPHFVPAPGTVGQVPHLSGGVGDGDRAGMEAVKDQYNLRLRFSIANSEADVPPIRIRITDEGGRQTLLETQSQGPWFYAKLPPRQYLLHLNYRGQVQERKVAVPGNGAVGLSFDWDR